MGQECRDGSGGLLPVGFVRVRELKRALIDLPCCEEYGRSEYLAAMEAEFGLSRSDILRFKRWWQSVPR